MPLAFSSDARWLASSCEATPGILLWDWSAPGKPVQLPGPDVFRLAFAKAGSLLYAGGFNGEITLWDCSRREVVKRTSHHRGYVFDLALSPDGLTLASAGADQTIRLWDAKTLSPLATLTGHENEVWTVAYSPDGRTLLSAGKDGTARLWAAQRREDTVVTISGIGRRFCFSAAGKSIVALATNGWFETWGTNGVREAPVGPEATPDRISLVDRSREYRSALFESTNRTTVVWDLETNGPIATLRSAEPLGDFVLSPDRRWSYGGGKRQGPSWLWDLEAGRIQNRFDDYSTEACGSVGRGCCLGPPATVRCQRR